MKKRAALYAIFCCVVILVLASCLVFKVRAKEQEPAERATAIRLNTPREITITTNKKIELLDGFISVEPENAIDLMDYSISSSSTTKPDYLDFDFSAKTFVALKTGYYYVSFSVPKNEYSNWKEILKIHAVADTQQDFNLKTNQIMIGESKSLEEIFGQNSSFDYEIKLSNNNLIFSDGVFQANGEGITKVFITITRGYVRYTNEYEIHVINDFSQPNPNDEESNPSEKGDSGETENQGNQGGGNSGGESGGESNLPEDGQGETGGNTGSSADGEHGDGHDEGNNEPSKDDGKENQGGQDSGDVGGNEGGTGGQTGGETGDDNTGGNTGSGTDGEQGDGHDEGNNEPSKDDNQENQGGQDSGDVGGNGGGTGGQTGGNEEENGNDSGEGQGNTGGESSGETEQKPQEKYELKIKSQTYNLNGVYTIQYEILLGSIQHVSQKIMATVSDPTIAKVTGCLAPFINLRILKSGSFTLTLTLVDNPEISFSIDITI